MLPTDGGQQLLFCLRFGLLGLALGVFYDVLRAVRTHFRLKRWGTGLLDGLFCLVTLVCFLLLMLRGTDGRLRLYLPAGLAAGFLLYRGTVSVYFLRLSLRTLDLIEKTAKAAERALLWVFSFPRGN